MGYITYLKGDATLPSTKGNKIIVHICNDIGKWGKGFVLSLSKRWELPEKEYRRSYSSFNKPILGEVQFVKVERDILVANIIGQRGIRYSRDPQSPSPIRYDAVEEGLLVVTDKVLKHNASVHMPRIGCGLAGGDWGTIEGIINKTLINKGIKVYVYDL